MLKPRVRVVVVVAVLLSPVLPRAWNNGPSGNAATNQASECANPPYATHDWIADHAVDLLPDAEKAWLLSHKTFGKRRSDLRKARLGRCTPGVAQTVPRPKR